MSERRTPFHGNHIGLGAKMIKGGGEFMFPISYITPKEEHLHVRQKLGMQELSSMGKIDIKGPQAEEFISRLIVNEIKDMKVGHIRYSTMCREDGGVIDDQTVYKLNDEHYWIIASSANRARVVSWIEDKVKKDKVYVTDLTGAIALPCIQGPRSREFLKATIRDVDFGALKYFNFAEGYLGETKLIVSRTGISGELGYELYLPSEEAAVVWDNIIEKGKEFDLKPYGVAAMRTLALEKAFIFHGSEVTEALTPFNAGVDRFIRFDKQEFIGKESLMRIKEKGVDRCLVGLFIEGETPAAAKSKLFLDNEEVGAVTYSNIGHTVGKVLALAHINSKYTKDGTKLSVLTGDVRIKAQIVPLPFYDPHGIKLRS
jgi:aminomethyltransferase